MNPSRSIQPPHPAHLVSWFASPLGLLCISHDGTAIIGVNYATPILSIQKMAAQATLTACCGDTQATALPRAWQQALADYFAGELDALLELPVRLQQGTPFQQQVWCALRQIPAGQTYSYRQLAQAIGRPQAMRAVGQALSKNPISIVFPCHRVILQTGGLGGYAGRSDIGQQRKQFLLWHECGFGAQRIASHPPHESPQPRRDKVAERPLNYTAPSE